MTLQNVVDGMLSDLAGGSHMEVGATIRHPDGRMVKIKDGAFLRNGRVSNWWTWRPVLEDGSLGKEEGGYGW